MDNLDSPRIDLWALADLSGGPDGCWPWLGNRTASGYGRVRVAGRLMYAHRVAFLLGVGPLADGLLVRHACDNPPCVNPGHLDSGTHTQNMADRAMRGRSHPRKLSDTQAAILATIPEALPALATRFGVSRRTAYRAIARIRAV